MTNETIYLLFILGYFAVLMLISKLTSRNADDDSFFLGNKKSPWFLVAFGMIGASLSGVTFISVPGNVGQISFTYLQIVFGYLVGYIIVAEVLMPLYYRKNLISIYTYLQERYGNEGYKIGSIYFLISRSLGAAFRLYLVALVLQNFVFAAWNVPFAITVAISIAFIYLYSFKNGIKTIVWTDTLQTLFLLLAAGGTVWYINHRLDWGFLEMVIGIKESGYSQIFDWDISSSHFFFKDFIAGMFITICMTGLDQDMMQKNLSCKDIGSAKKNMYSMSIILVFANLLFLSLGALLYIFAVKEGIMESNFTNEVLMQEGKHLTMSLNGTESYARKDELFPFLALKGIMPQGIAILFLLGLVAAAYSSADSALTALTTSFSIDILGKGNKDIAKKTRTKVHIGFAILLLILILIFYALNNKSIIDLVLEAAGYTYGPLLGLYAFGIVTKRKIAGKLLVLICLLSPLLTFIIAKNQEFLFGDFRIGFLILLINGLFTFAGLLIFSNDKRRQDQKSL